MAGSRALSAGGVGERHWPDFALINWLESMALSPTEAEDRSCRLEPTRRTMQSESELTRQSGDQTEALQCFCGYALQRVYTH